MERLNFIQASWFEQNFLKNFPEAFQLIVSNPPYIATEEVAHLAAEVKHEPHLALDGGADGLHLLRQIISLAADYLNPRGTLALEIGAGQSPAVSALFDGKRWEGGVKKDFAGIERFIFARLR